MKRTVDDTYSFIVNESLGKVLGADGYERTDDTFYRHRNGLKKLVIIWRDPHHKRIAMFTLHTGVFSDEAWQLMRPNEPVPDFPGLYSCLLVKRLGHFYGKQRPDKWLTVDALTDAEAMINELNALLNDTLLPYLNAFQSLDDVLNQINPPWIGKMRLLARLGRREEARAEMQRLIASRHQRPFREMVVNIAKADGLIN